MHRALVAARYATPVLRGALAVLLLGGCLSERGTHAAFARGELLAKLADASAMSDAVIASACASTSSEDDDHDGVPDACEALLADRFAPVVIHSTDESNYPTNVDDFLGETVLAFRDDGCDAASEAVPVKEAPTQQDLLRRSFPSPCGGAPVTSDGSRSLGKHRTYFLSDVREPVRGGSVDTRAWTTYVHAYPNDRGGVTLQYWRFYAFNDALNDHGGDWEGLHVVLGRDRAPVSVRLLGHSAIRELAPRELAWEGTHPVVYSEGGGHATRASGEGIVARDCVDSEPCMVDLDDPSSFVRQETWAGGHVTWPDGQVTHGGALVNMGEKSAPLHGQVFLRYSGLWGSPGVFYMTSGYWGPAYNETSMGDDGFITAWCDGIDGGKLDVQRECKAVKRER
jgi:hypothetical protein